MPRKKSSFLIPVFTDIMGQSEVMVMPLGSNGNGSAMMLARCPSASIAVLLRDDQVEDLFYLLKEIVETNRKSS